MSCKGVLIAIFLVLVSTSLAKAQTPPATEKNAPAAGANSFTESQAKDRIEKAGFTEVTSLRKDDQGFGAPMRSKAANKWLSRSTSAAT